VPSRFGQASSYDAVGPGSRPDAGDADVGPVVWTASLSRRDFYRPTDSRPGTCAFTLREPERTYGRCEDCGARISTERLRAVPFARRCVECQRKAEAVARIEKEPDREGL